MAKGTQRTIYFYEIALEVAGNSPAGDVESIEPGFWPMLHKKLSEMEDVDRRMTYRGRKYVGEARVSRSPVADYFYIGKARRGADWPDFSDANGLVSSLPIENDPDVALIEPAYLLEVPRTNLVAMVRTSGGPTTSALEHWINGVMGMINNPETFILRPYVRTDDLQRLQKAQGGSRIHMKVDANQMADKNPHGLMAQAVAEVQSGLHGNASVEMTVSFGNSRPDDLASQEVASAVKEMLDLGIASQLDATLYVPNEDGELKKDKIDFIRDRVVAKETFGESADQPISPEAMVHALSRAIEKFRETV